ncbi:MAG: LysM peptidoglycan-binding domain-containing protein [Chloroflexi bacterium]|nr:LysM peptidoglycan-binding domain-containing protein [Chloroflexota bacterium]
MTLRLSSVLLVLIAWLAAGCNISMPDAKPSPTIEIEAIATASPAPSATDSLVPSTPSPTAAPLQLVTALPSATEPQPSPPPEPSATSPFFEYTVQEGETLFYIIQLPQHGYSYEPNVAATVVALNDNIRDADSVIGGITILIPRPTATATPAGAQATQALLATIGLDDSSGAVLDSGAAVGCHDVVAGDSMVTIAHTYSTTLEILSDLNQGEVNWYGCNFKEPAGGPDCRPTLSIGQCVRVPKPTPLPTKAPTPTGNETATPTATKLAPRLLHPADGALIAPTALTLHWVGLAGLHPAEVYLLELIDQTANAAYRQVTRANSFRVPEALIPADGQPHLIQWQVTVARKNDQGAYFYVGAPGEVNTFQWRSR